MSDIEIYSSGKKIMVPEEYLNYLETSEIAFPIVFGDKRILVSKRLKVALQINNIDQKKYKKVLISKSESFLLELKPNEFLKIEIAKVISLEMDSENMQMIHEI